MVVDDISSRFRVISLADAQERRSHIGNQFSRRGIVFRFFNAVDARTLHIGSTPYKPHSGTRWMLSPSEVAVFESHRALWKICTEGDQDHMVIFEDDVVLGDKFSVAYRAIISKSPEFDIVKLDWHPLKTRVAGLKHIAPDFQIARIVKTMPSAAAYVVSRAGAKKLLHWSETYCDHLDDFIFMPRDDWRLFQLIPPVAVQAYMIEDNAAATLGSTVTSGQRSTITGVADRFAKPPISFRISRELKKAVHKAKLFWKIRRKGMEVHNGILPFDFHSVE